FTMYFDFNSIFVAFMTMLLPIISKQLNGTIWRLEIDGLSDTVFLEVRTADRQVSFTSVSLQTGHVNFNEYTTPERWLTGIEAAYNNVLLLHHYQAENSPVHKGITAIDSMGQVLWSNYSYAFDHLSVNGPVVFNIQLQPKKLFIVDIKTGTYLRKFDEILDTEVETPLAFPQMAQASQADLPLPVDAHLNIAHYLNHNKLRIVSLHTFIAGQLKQHLYVTDGVCIVYEDLLNEDIQKMQPESFILYKNWLIYIKNKSELKVINL
ncbi:MAG: DUF4905 domain-containing protein, partial [Bacteroidota bacterium]